MTFKVVITEPARLDIRSSAAFIKRTSVPAANKWVAELRRAVFSLSEMPERFAVIPEAGDWHTPHRAIIYHSHRIIYRVDMDAGVVYVVRVYHSARQPLEENEL